jgi:uncharacterized membrane protein YgcG
MRRVALRSGALVAAAALLLFPVVAGMSSSPQSSTPDPVTISTYTAHYAVDANGVLTARETIVGDFPIGRHGIFRYWDVQDMADKHVRLRPQDLEVTRDGNSEPFTLQWEQGRRFRVAKIGSADVILPAGEHTYVLTYRIKGALAHGTIGSGTTASWGATGANKSLFNWQVVAGGWAMSMHKVQVTVDLPAKVTDAQCAVRDRRLCAVEGIGSKRLQVSATNLQAYTPISVRAEVPVATPERPSLPWTVTFDRLFGQNGPLAYVVLLFSLAALVVGYLWDRNSREATPGYPVQYEPPAGLGPVQTAYVTTERTPRRALVATLLYQAQQGLTTLTRNGDDWLVENKAGADAWAKVDDVTRHVGASLGVDTPNGRFDADGSVSAGQSLKAVQTSLSSVTDTWATAAGVQSPSSGETLGRLLVIGAALAAAGLTFFVQTASSLWVIPFAAFTVGGAGLLAPGVGRRRTLLGRDVWSRAGGFERLLSTDSAKERFDFSGKQELYTAFIPFAVAFDCADAWARKYEQSTGVAAPVPVWYGGGTGTGHGTFFGSGDAFSSFESSLSSSISAYSASQSSSGGGGGFSGGGGGGGGGGGSW